VKLERKGRSTPKDDSRAPMFPWIWTTRQDQDLRGPTQELQQDACHALVKYYKDKKLDSSSWWA
jgi:hypothetical protein